LVRPSEHRNFSYAGIVVLTAKGKDPDPAKRPRRFATWRCRKKPDKKVKNPSPPDRPFGSEDNAW
jgi:hypothetical protein